MQQMSQNPVQGTCGLVKNVFGSPVKEFDMVRRIILYSPSGLDNYLCLTITWLYRCKQDWLYPNLILNTPKLYSALKNELNTSRLSIKAAIVFWNLFHVRFVR